ncbi:hypothetical protein GJ699_13340 [Duganella sp. FT80W]|uniref:SLATT domain-containing protein n=1 Tax=Duganella guangzhouensis TaxID=2666084 RepID=A0A6I2L2C9_9BURK|nr:hypothetical protein [Duganella guangzhouensis]MRW90974.1 hypothetical protein [Duganella guangzhouensis]
MATKSSHLRQLKTTAYHRARLDFLCGAYARWVWLDSITKIAVAIASGGAALAGLVFWKNSDYTFLWPMFTSTSALLAIISKQLNVAETLKMHATSVAALGNLDTEIGSMILRMKIHTDFGIEEFEKDLLALRNKFGAESNMFVHDLLLTQALRTKTQAALNRTLGSS